MTIIEQLIEIIVFARSTQVIDFLEVGATVQRNGPRFSPGHMNKLIIFAWQSWYY